MSVRHKTDASLVSVRLLRSEALIADKCQVAESFFQRLRGLIGRSALAQGEGMLFPRCNDIHMWFMSVPIDVVFLRKSRTENQFIVASTRSSLRPWRPLPVRDGQASETLELPAGTVERLGIGRGDELCIS